MGFLFRKKSLLQKLEEQMNATALKTWEVVEGFVCKREFSDTQRKGAAKTGEAMPDGSFPIGNIEDLHNAIMLMHNSKDPSAAKDHIVRRAHALGAHKELPKTWGKTKPNDIEKIEKGEPLSDSDWESVV